MTARAYATRQQRIAAGCCPRCGKPVSPWPLHRADVCHVHGAAVCPRHWPDIHAAEARIIVNKRP